MYSMTGYASKSRDYEGYTLQIEIKSLNSKFLEVKFRLPDYMEYMEYGLRKILKSYIERGKVDVNVNVTAKESLELEFLKSLLDKYYSLIWKVGEEKERPFEFSLSDFLSLKYYINPFGKNSPISVPEGAVRELFVETLKSYQDSRLLEGENTKKDLLSCIEEIKGSINRIEKIYPSVTERYKEQLRDKVRELIMEKVDDMRLLMEVGIFANRVDISEEISRINCHVQRMIQTLNSKKACGREIDFIIQEINREINTIGSKVPDYLISEEVVNTKINLEKIKEQVRNIE